MMVSPFFCIVTAGSCQLQACFMDPEWDGAVDWLLRECSRDVEVMDAATRSSGGQKDVVVEQGTHWWSPIMKKHAPGVVAHRSIRILSACSGISTEMEALKVSWPVPQTEPFKFRCNVMTN